MSTKPFGLHIFSHNRTDWVQWFAKREDREKAYKKAKKKVGVTKTRKTPYRYVKKVGF